MIFALALMAALAAPAARQTVREEPPMSFTRHGPEASADRGVIKAKGRITSETAAQFERFIASELYPDSISYITLDSSGGDLFGAMELGRAIHRRLLRTAVVEWEEDKGHCLSACAYAFLGGSQRTLGVWEGDPEGLHANGERLGFHRYSGEEVAIADRSPAAVRALTRLTSAEAQAAASELAEYVEEMGIDLKILSLASQAGPDSMLFPSREELVRLRILQAEGFSAFALVPDGSGISAVSYSRSGGDKIQFGVHCGPGDAAVSSLRLVLSRPKNGGRITPAPQMPVAIAAFDKGGGRRASDHAKSLALPENFTDAQWVAAATAGPPQEIINGITLDYNLDSVIIAGEEIRIYGDRDWTHIVMWLDPSSTWRFRQAVSINMKFDAPTYTGLFGYYPSLVLSDSDRRAISAVAKPCFIR